MSGFDPSAFGFLEGIFYVYAFVAGLYAYLEEGFSRYPRLFDHLFLSASAALLALGALPLWHHYAPRDRWAKYLLAATGVLAAAYAGYILLVGYQFGRVPAPLEPVATLIGLGFGVLLLLRGLPLVAYGATIPLAIVAILVAYALFGDGRYLSSLAVLIAAPFLGIGAALIPPVVVLAFLAAAAWGRVADLIPNRESVEPFVVALIYIFALVLAPRFGAFLYAALAAVLLLVPPLVLLMQEAASYSIRAYLTDLLAAVTGGGPLPGSPAPALTALALVLLAVLIAAGILGGILQTRAIRRWHYRVFGLLGYGIDPESVTPEDLKPSPEVFTTYFALPVEAEPYELALPEPRRGGVLRVRGKALVEVNCAREILGRARLQLVLERGNVTLAELGEVDLADPQPVPFEVAIPARFLRGSALRLQVRARAREIPARSEPGCGPHLRTRIEEAELSWEDT